MVSFTVILRPFQSPVALAMSSPTFFGDRPRGPILGVRADVAPTSPPVHPHDFDLAGVELRRHGGGGWRRMNPDSGRLKKVTPLPPPSRKPKGMVEDSDKTWFTGEGNGKSLQYSCLENPMNCMKREKAVTLKDETPPRQ